MQVVGTTGKSTTQNGRYYAYTVGQVVINTAKGTSRTLTQGFHQPDVCPLVSTNDLNLAAWGISVFPNPTMDVLQVRFDATDNKQLTATIFDLSGRSVLQHILLTPSFDPTLIDCTTLQPGIYFLHLTEPATQQHATMRIIRL